MIDGIDPSWRRLIEEALSREDRPHDALRHLLNSYGVRREEGKEAFTFALIEALVAERQFRLFLQRQARRRPTR